MYISTGKTIHLAPVFAIHGQFQVAEDYLSKILESLSNMGLDGGCGTKIIHPLVAALCGKTADAQRLVQQFLDSRDFQEHIVHRKFSTVV